MTDDREEARRERRLQRANQIRIKASPLRLPRDEFQKRFVGTQIVADERVREQLENQSQELFCDACAAPYLPLGIEVRPLHVRIEDDPLKNFWKLAHLQCFGCGFNEIVPLQKPAFTAEELEQVACKPTGNFTQVHDSFEIRLTDDVWDDALAEQLREFVDKQQKKVAYAQIQAHQAQAQARIKAFRDQLQNTEQQLFPLGGAAQSPDALERARKAGVPEHLLSRFKSLFGQ